MAIATSSIALTIAGFDSSAGAGLQADLLTFHNHGYHPLTASTSLVVETPLEVREVVPTTPEILHQQISLLLDTYPVSTVKIGLLASTEQVKIVSQLLTGKNLPLVLDPVGISTTGTSLQAPGTSEAILEHLAPLATLITPNFPEAQSLLKNWNQDDPERLAHQLSEKGRTNVLLTGGHHGDGEELTDILIENEASTQFTASKMMTPAPLHGTGCVLSSAIAAGLGRGKNLINSIQEARRYLRDAISNHHNFTQTSDSEPLLALKHPLQRGHDE